MLLNNLSNNSSDLSLDTLTDFNFNMFDRISDGFAFYKIVFDENNKPIDFILLYANDIFSKFTNINAKDYINQKVSDILLKHSSKYFENFELYKENFLFEDKVKTEYFNELSNYWLEVSAYLYSNKILISFVSNISEKKRMEIAVQESHKFLKETLDTLPVQIAILDDNSTIIYTNQAWRKRLKENNKISGNYVIGSNYLNEISKETIQKIPFISDFENFLINKSDEFYVEFPFYVSDNEIKWFSIKAIHFNGNGIAKVMIAKEDITRRKLDEAELKKLSRAIEYSPAAVIITDDKGIIEYVNPKFIQITGYEAAEVIGQNPRILKSGEMSPENYKKMWETIIRGDEWRGEFHNKTKDGRLYWEFASISPIRNDKGQITHFIAVKEDITERKKIEAELKAAKIQSESANKIKSAFLANMSHEIRTPMTSILGMAELLFDTNVDNQQKEYINIIRDSSELLMSIINDILDFSKIEAGRMVIEKIKFNFRDTINSIIGIMELKARAKNLSIKSVIDLDVPEFINGDPVRLKQIILNLIGNAIKFTETGGIFFKISVIERNELFTRIKFMIKDTGIGIAPDVIDILFNPFIQADGSMTRKYGGTGLGLSISKRLVELMNGNIGVNSLLNNGSEFWFDIKCDNFASDSSHSDNVIEDNLINSNQQVKPIIALGLKNRSILLVDDNFSNQKVIRMLLKKLGYTNVTQVNNGLEAFEAFKIGDYSLILMDCQMVVMDGYKASKLIREHEKLNNKKPVSIIALTADAMQGSGKRCIEAGMDAYLTKPVGIAQLQNLLETWLN